MKKEASFFEQFLYMVLPSRVRYLLWKKKRYFDWHQRIKKAESEGSLNTDYEWGEYFQSLMLESKVTYQINNGRTKDELDALSYHRKAIAKFKEAANKGNVNAWRELGGLWDQDGNCAQAFNAFLAGAERGDPYCQACVGEMYLRGDGVAQSEHLAFEWISEAICPKTDTAKGNESQWKSWRFGEFVDSYYRMSQFYFNGTVVEKNISEAYFWVHIALSFLKTIPRYSRNSKLAARAVGPRIHQGESLCDVRKDKRTVKDLHQDWLLYKSEIAKHMSSDQIADVEKRAAQWWQASQYAREGVLSYKS